MKKRGMSMDGIDLEALLTALRNTKTKQGAKRALREILPIWEEIESSFFGPAIWAELSRLKELARN